MNIPVSIKINKIILNLERFRWMKRGVEQTPASINVNIPAYELKIVEQGDEVF
jgi:murein L,D-transpeptidase YcbB/YkuD